MPRSTKLTRQITDPLNTRITTIETRNLVDVGDNISTLNNDAQYQTLTQVNAIADSKINALIDGAPATLDTLKELATEAEAADTALDGLLAVTSNQGTAITALQTENSAQNTAIADLVQDVASIETELSTVTIPATRVIYDNTSSEYTGIADVQAALDYMTPLLNKVLARTGIRRLVLGAGNESFTIVPFEPKTHNVINSTPTVKSISFPSAFPEDVGLDFVIINNPTSVANIIANGNVLAPGEQYAAQWDGVEWVEN